MPDRTRLGSAVLGLVVLVGCTASQRAETVDSGAADGNNGGACAIGAFESWPEADQLFRHDPSWIGGDAAYSVDLGGGRVLWLFGDSFIAKSPARSRADAWFIRNSVAIQSGSADPSAGDIAFSWREDGGGASAFFPGRDGHWFWPLGGVRLGSTLILFLLEEKSVSTGLGFESVGTRVFFVANPDAPPLDWVLTEGTLPSFGFPVAFGAAVVREDPYVFVWGDEEPGDHSVYIARYDVTALEAGDASSPLFLTGGSWAAPSASPPDVIFPSATSTDNPPTELSVESRCDGSWLAVHSTGFGSTDIALRTAPSPPGPWSVPRTIFTPPESGGAGVLVYAAKAHPELSGGSLVVTYATNASFSQVASDTNLYYPRFVRAR